MPGEARKTPARLPQTQSRNVATLEILSTVLRAALDALDAAARTASAERLDWVPQSESPLGRKRHCEAARRRIREGLGGAAIIGRKHLLSPEAIRDEIESLGRPKPKREEPVSDGVEKLRRELRLVGGAL